MLDWTPAFTSAVLDIAVRATLLALLVAVLVRAFRVRSPRVRHTLWLGVLLAMLTMPGLRLLIPDLPVPMGSLAFVSSADRSAGTSPLQWVTDAGASAVGGAAGQPAPRHAANGGRPDRQTQPLSGLLCWWRSTWLAWFCSASD